MEQWDIVEYQGKKVILLEKDQDSPSPIWKLCPLYTCRGNVQIFPEAELTPTIAEYEIPVSWGCFGIITVKAASMQEAISIFDQEAEEYPLPTDSDYIDGSFTREQYSSLEEAKECYAMRLLPCFYPLKEKVGESADET